MPLFRVQKKNIRAISFSDKYASSSPLFQRLEILKLNDLHTFNLLCFVFQCNQGTSIGQALKGDMYVSGINTTLYGKRIYRYNTMEQLEYQYKTQSLFKYF